MKFIVPYLYPDTIDQTNENVRYLADSLNDGVHELTISTSVFNNITVEQSALMSNITFTRASGVTLVANSGNLTWLSAATLKADTANIGSAYITSATLVGLSSTTGTIGTLGSTSATLQTLQNPTYANIASANITSALIASGSITSATIVSGNFTQGASIASGTIQTLINATHASITSASITTMSLGYSPRLSAGTVFGTSGNFSYLASDSAAITTANITSMTVGSATITSGNFTGGASIASATVGTLQGLIYGNAGALGAITAGDDGLFLICDSGSTGGAKWSGAGAAATTQALYYSRMLLAGG